MHHGGVVIFGAKVFLNAGSTLLHYRRLIKMNKICVALVHRQGVLGALRRCVQRLQAPPNYIAGPSQHYRETRPDLLLRVDQIT